MGLLDLLTVGFLGPFDAYGLLELYEPFFLAIGRNALIGSSKLKNGVDEPMILSVK